MRAEIRDTTPMADAAAYRAIELIYHSYLLRRRAPRFSRKHRATASLVISIERRSTGRHLGNAKKSRAKALLGFAHVGP